MKAATQKFATDQIDNIEQGGAYPLNAIDKAIFRAHATATEAQATLDALLRLRSSLASGESIESQVVEEDELDEWIGTAEAERITGVNRRTLVRWAQKKLVDGRPVGELSGSGHWRFRKRALLKLAFAESERAAKEASVANVANARLGALARS